MGKHPDGPSFRPCEACEQRPTYRAVWQRGDRSEEHWFCPECDDRESTRLQQLGRGTRLPTQVLFAVEGLDDCGGPSGWFLEATEVALIRRGRPVLHFTNADTLKRAIAQASPPIKLIAMETLGEPRRHLQAQFLCDQQAALPA